ncbi:PREDICTED: UDP-glycosyltransferase 76F1-like [Tarenaya hassleriana]|uniref:UDP-glycosyltransferase 76F1-like n=1 Tax=Tarenaya hassleriana TaxID=28532 RepID=UPI00053C1977|nr:PREDICTED: UDP-glycosyltransferase 76F1-like [Tarenaya hassleriana]
MEDRKGRRIIMFPLPFPGHLNPMLQLAGIFHRRGFSVIVIHTSFNFPDPSRHPHFTFRTVGDENTLTQSEASGLDLVGLLRELNHRFAEPFRRALAEETAEEESGEAVSCLVSDAIWGFAGEVADEVRVSRMVLRTGGAASFCAFAAFPLLRDKGYLPIQDSRLEEPVTELPPLKVKDLPVIETSKPGELYRIVSDMVKGVKSSSGAIWNTFEDLEGPPLDDLRSQFRDVPIFPIGPFHKHLEDFKPTENQESINAWLDKQEPRSAVYVSFGSLAAISREEFLEIAWGLSNSGQSFVCVIRQGFVRGTEWIEALPRGFVEKLGQKGKFVKWANQHDVLSHRAVGAFWTHCGWNSTLESICEGVPMICTPCFTDQHVNSRYVSDVWRVGVRLERSEMDRWQIEKVIRRVMVESFGYEMRERSLKLKERAEICLGQDGSSSKSLDRLVSHVLSFDSSFAFASERIS